MRDGRTRLGDGDAITEYRKEANPNRACRPEASLEPRIKTLVTDVPPKQPASVLW